MFFNKLCERLLKKMPKLEEKNNLYLLHNIDYKSMADSAPVMMINVNRDGLIRYMNYVHPDYTLEQVIGSSVFDYVAPEYHELYKENMKYAMESGKSTTFETEVNLADSVAWFELHMAPIMTNEKADGIVVITQNVTEKKIALKKLENAIQEKEILLKEVHHRAKNNLQVLSSILNLQKDKTSDNKVIGVLEECKNSIHSLALAHECLYKSNDFSKVNFSDYIERFCSHFDLTVNSQAKVTLELDLSATYVSMDKAITSGLILSEILINAFKHAFPEQEHGTIKIQLVEKDDRFSFFIEDNGIGFPEELDVKNAESLGMELIRILVEQLDGELEITSSSGKGAKYKIAFNR